MNERDFIYWLNGFLESGLTETLNAEQVKTIKEHLALVSLKVTPDNYQQTITTTPAFPPGKMEIIC